MIPHRCIGSDFDVACAFAVPTLKIHALPGRVRICEHSAERGEVVLLDRFFLSTYAYQIAGRGLNEDLVRDANRLAVDGLVPDLTVVMDMPVERGPIVRVDAEGDEREVFEAIANAVCTHLSMLEGGLACASLTTGSNPNAG